MQMHLETNRKSSMAVIIFRVSHIDDAKCIIVVTAVCVSVCLSVPRRIPTLVLRGPRCNFGMVKGTLQLCTIWWIFNQCTGFLAMTT